MTYVTVVSVLCFIFLAIGIVAVYAGEMLESFYQDKTRLFILGDICSGVATVWLFAPYMIDPERWVVALMLLVSAVFWLFMWRYYAQAKKMK